MERIAPCQLKNKENPCHISCPGKSSRPGKGWPPPELWWLKRCEDVTPSLVNTIILNLQTTMGVFVPSYLEMPCWLIMDRDDLPTWADGPVAVMPIYTLHQGKIQVVRRLEMGNELAQGR